MGLITHVTKLYGVLMGIRNGIVGLSNAIVGKREQKDCGLFGASWY